jgi:hypothetical protein
MEFSSLPIGRVQQPAPIPHFPDTLHAVIWRNWDVIPVERLAEVLKGTPAEITEVAIAMGLPPQRSISCGELRRNYVTVLRRNWHLLPYEQLCPLLDWDAARMQFALNEDDFMYAKLGGYKPNCPPVCYRPPDEASRVAADGIARVVDEELDGTIESPAEPFFGFIERFRGEVGASVVPADPAIGLRMVYPYFLRYGDPLMGEGIEDLPEGYLAELAGSGINAIWLHVVLNTLAPWELAPALSKGWEKRLQNLNCLVKRCRAFGIDVLLYLNEPRSMPREFFDEHPELRGVEETPDRAPYSPDVVALCVSTKPVQDFLVNAVRHVFEHVPGLGGVMAITFSENLTNCYSREYDPNVVDEFVLRSIPGEVAPKTVLNPCPRCAERGPETINADVCTLMERGMRLAGSEGKFLLYAWSTPEKWMPGIVARLPESVWLLCISEWGHPFTRGDYSGTVNEYSISVVGPSDQSRRQWEMALRRGLRTAAKMQAANTFEVISLPYIPALRLVAEHLANVTATNVSGLMLGWTPGGSPSPNLDLVAEFTRTPRPNVAEALSAVARRRYGDSAAGGVVEAWNLLSDAYLEFPFDLTVCYFGPQSLGPANLLYAERTGLPATMCTFPFDDLEGWRGPYSEETFLAQFEKLARLWQLGVDRLERLRQEHSSAAVEDEWRIAEAAQIYFLSTANQIRFIRARDRNPEACPPILQEEILLARRLFDLVAQDSRIGFEATNHYGFTRFDLVEKILSCRQILNDQKEVSHGED